MTRLTDPAWFELQLAALCALVAMGTAFSAHPPVVTLVAAAAAVGLALAALVEEAPL